MLTRRIDHGVIQGWRKQQSGTSVNARFVKWSSSDAETLVDDSQSRESGEDGEKCMHWEISVLPLVVASSS